MIEAEARREPGRGFAPKLTKKRYFRCRHQTLGAELGLGAKPPPEQGLNRIPSLTLG
jgi:hypothetical protein